MSVQKKTTFLSLLIACMTIVPFVARSANGSFNDVNEVKHTLARDTLLKELGWVESNENYCGGYYLEQPFVFQEDIANKTSVEVTGNEGLVSQRGTSILEGKVSVTRRGQQITANKAYLYRDPQTAKLHAIDMIGNVHFREPNTLIVAKVGRYNFETTTKSLSHLVYRTSLNGRQILGPKIPIAEMQHERKISTLTAWGKAYEFSQSEPGIYELANATFTTCPPINPTWKIQANHITLNKNTGRGVATGARLLVKELPVFYIPYFNFSIDGQRKSGFLMPTIGGNSNWGPYFLAPYYWNMAPNYDMTITPGLLEKRGLRVVDNFRYLSHTSSGRINVSVVPHDRQFIAFKKQIAGKPEFSQSTDANTQAEFNRLQTYNSVRKALSWKDDSLFNEHWSSHVDFNYAGDDYYLTDYGNDLNEITKNQLLQEGDIYYKGENWNFTGRLQAYQTLHPVNDPLVLNNYRRVPQLILNGDYPDQPFGLEYFISNEATVFEFLKTPGGDPTVKPIGNRLHTQPGISLPLYYPYFFINPRLQLALTNYSLRQTQVTPSNSSSLQTQATFPSSINRAVPIFDIASGFSLERDVSLFGNGYRQTLEPQIYYTYIPFRNQSDIPVFDTSVNTLVYDQIFNYNRFSGLDRIGDTNQVAVGVTTRFIDQASGFEKVRIGVGDIIYFARRKVTLCNDPSICTDFPANPSNDWRLSPISGLLKFTVIPNLSIASNIIWNPISKQLDNAIFSLHYQSDTHHIANFSYSYAHNGDIFSGIATNDSVNNLKVTDVSLVWPLTRDVSGVGRWAQNWNRRHLQNLIYGLQYDTCCWAVRLVGGRAFTGVDPNNNNKAKYASEFYIQFDLKGLGNISSGNPSGLLSSITGYNPQFGQDLR